MGLKAFPSVESVEKEPVPKPDESSSGGTATKSKSPKNRVGFQTLGLGRAVFGGIMKIGYKVPTPIQRKTLPIALLGKDIVAMARTGSGKTAAFLIPLLERLGEHSSIYGARGIVLSPTRELAQQTYKFATSLGKLTSLRICLLQGGDSMDAQFEALSNNPDILVATPGRLMHMLAEVKDLSLQRIEILVFDEADRLFEMGFAQQLHEIIEQVPKNRQTMLFSATMPRQLMEFAQAGLENPELIRLDTDTKISENLKLAFFFVRSIEKTAALIFLLTEVIDKEDQTIIFTATRHHVEYLAVIMEKYDLTFSVAYGSMDMESRKLNMERFRKKETSILLVTDIAARGLDIPLLNNVINYDFPSKAKLFVHRTGRSARQGRSGTAFSFVTRDEVPYVIDLHLFLGRSLVTDYPEKYSVKEMTPDHVHFGRIPQILLDQEVERLQKIKQDESDLVGLEKSMKNAHALYVKTRQDASRRSVSRAKNSNLEHVHPLFLEESLDRKASVNAISAIKNFRPNQTVFEVEASKRGKQLEVSSSAVAMKMKRRSHQSIITETNDDPVAEEKTTSVNSGSEITIEFKENKNQEMSFPSRKRMSKAERKRLKSGRLTPSNPNPSKHKNLLKSFKDPESYIDSIPSSYDMVAEAHLAVNKAPSDKTDADVRKNLLNQVALDLLPDDKKEISEAKKMYHWDRRKKKYIKATMEEHVKSKRIRNESGARINMKNRGKLYEKWQKQTKKRISTYGTSEIDNSGDVNVKRLSRALRKQKYLERSAKEELKDETKIRKEAKEKEKRRAKNARGQKRKMLEREKRKETPAFVKRQRMPEPGFSRNSRSRVMIKQTKSKKKRR